MIALGCSNRDRCDNWTHFLNTSSCGELGYINQGRFSKAAARPWRILKPSILNKARPTRIITIEILRSGSKSALRSTIIPTKKATANITPKIVENPASTPPSNFKIRIIAVL